MLPLLRLAPPDAVATLTRRTLLPRRPLSAACRNCAASSPATTRSINDFEVRWWPDKRHFSRKRLNAASVGFGRTVASTPTYRACPSSYSDSPGYADTPTRVALPWEILALLAKRAWEIPTAGPTPKLCPRARAGPRPASSANPSTSALSQKRRYRTVCPMTRGSHAVSRNASQSPT